MLITQQIWAGLGSHQMYWVARDGALSQWAWMMGEGIPGIPSQTPASEGASAFVRYCTEGRANQNVRGIGARPPMRVLIQHFAGDWPLSEFQIEDPDTLDHALTAYFAEQDSYFESLLTRGNA